MTPLFDTLRAFAWFLYQTGTVGGLGFRFFIGGVLVVAAIMWLTFPSQRAPDRGRFLLLLALPSVWTFVGLWGAWFWLAWEKNAPPNPAWVFYPVAAAPWLTFILSALLIWWLRGARLFVATFATANLYFLLAMYLLASASVSGVWL